MMIVPISSAIEPVADTVSAARGLGCKIRLLVGAPCAASSLLVATQAAAALVQNSFASGSLHFTLNRPGQCGQSVSAGGFTCIFNGKAFMSCCIQLANDFRIGTAYANYTVVPVASAHASSRSTSPTASPHS